MYMNGAVGEDQTQHLVAGTIQDRMRAAFAVVERWLELIGLDQSNRDSRKMILPEGN